MNVTAGRRPRLHGDGNDYTYPRAAACQCVVSSDYEARNLGGAVESFRLIKRSLMLGVFNQESKGKCFFLEFLGGRTGLEPATPGVTDPLSKSMFMRVSSQIVFQKTLKTCRFHAVFRTFIPKFLTRSSRPDPRQVQVHASRCAVQRQRPY